MMMVAFVAVLVLSATYLACASTSAPVPASMISALTAEAAAHLEADPDLFGPGMEKLDHVADVVCAVTVLGTEPAYPRIIGHVTTVYVWADCAAQAVDGAPAGEMVVPAVVHLRAGGGVQIPADDDRSPTAKSLFPLRLWGQTDQAPEAALLTR